MSIFTDHNKPTRNTVPELHGNGSYVLCGSNCRFLVPSKADFYPIHGVRRNTNYHNSKMSVFTTLHSWLAYTKWLLHRQVLRCLDRTIIRYKVGQYFTIMFYVFCRPVVPFTLYLPLNFQINDLDTLIEHSLPYLMMAVNPLNPELNPICYLLALLGAHHFLHVNRIRVKSLTFRRLMSYIYGAPILDVSRSHATTQHSR